MRRWPPRPSTALVRAQFLQESASCPVTAVRNFHLSGRWYEESGKNTPASTPAPRQPSRLQRSRNAFDQISSLSSNSNASSPNPTGFRNGGFRPGQSSAQAGDSRPAFRMQGSAGPGAPATRSSPPQGAVMARRRVGAPDLSNRRGGRGGSASNRSRGGSRAGGRGRGQSGPAANKNPSANPEEIEEEEMYLTPEEYLPDGLARHLLKEHDKHHGPKDYIPQGYTASELLAWTESQLPPLPGTSPVETLSKHLDSTVTHRAEFALTPTIDPIRQDARKLIAGHLVKFGDERSQKGTIIMANAPRMQNARKEQAEKLGLDPAASIEFAELPEELRRKTEGAVLGGKYELTQVKEGKKPSDAALQNALRGLQGNASYKPTNVARFLDAVEGLVEGKPRPTAPQIIRSG